MYWVIHISLQCIGSYILSLLYWVIHIVPSMYWVIHIVPSMYWVIHTAPTVLGHTYCPFTVLGHTYCPFNVIHVIPSMHCVIHTVPTVLGHTYCSFSVLGHTYCPSYTGSYIYCPFNVLGHAYCHKGPQLPVFLSAHKLACNNSKTTTIKHLKHILNASQTKKHTKLTKLMSTSPKSKFPDRDNQILFLFFLQSENGAIIKPCICYMKPHIVYRHREFKHHFMNHQCECFSLLHNCFLLQ